MVAGMEMTEKAALATLADEKAPITHKYRAVYFLKERTGEGARDSLVEALGLTKSVLLLHEICYALGQRKDTATIAPLTDVLLDESHHEVTRHEAAEALGAITNTAALDLLDRLTTEGSTQAIRETCLLAARRIRLMQQSPEEFAGLEGCRFSSVDPSPPFLHDAAPGVEPSAPEAEKVQALEALLLDPSADLFLRYRAMFSLRNMGTSPAIAALCRGLVQDTSSALFRHEVAYVLGQLESTESIDALRKALQRADEHPMVRHESAEALGSVATDGVLQVLKDFEADPEPMVAESCQVALDMVDYWSAWKEKEGETC